jgi:uncharacterized protein
MAPLATVGSVPARTDSFDLGALRLSSGEGRRLDLAVTAEPLRYGGQRYEVGDGPLPVRLDISRMTGHGYALRLRFQARLTGPCMRCLEPADPVVEVDAREVDQPGGGEQLDSPYLSQASVLDLRAWARDALALALPAQIVCRAECAGLCAVCGANLNDDPGHEHEASPDPRWAKLRELKLD